MDYQTIDINKIQSSSLNVRKIFDNSHVDVDVDLDLDLDFLELKKNIKQHGLINPLTVIFNNNSNMYEIIAGQRRFRALEELKFNEVYCKIVNSKLNEKDQIVLSLTENIHRKNMKLSNKIKIYNKLLIHCNNCKKELASYTSTSLSTINQYVQISHFPESVLDKLDNTGTSKISLDFAVSLSKIGIVIEDELLAIIDIFLDVAQKDRINILKKIKDSEKYNHYDDFHIYLNKIHNIKTQSLNDIKKKEDELKEFLSTNERTEKQTIILEKYNQKSINNCSDFNKHKNLKESDYNNIIQKIKEKNNNSIYINTNVRNPQLQNEYRKAIIQRFKKCIISDYDCEVCEAAHIIPFSESENFEIDNGLLLNCVLHNLFDKYYWSINPDTFCIEIFKPDTSNIYSILKEYDNKYIEILKEYPKIKEYLKNHYDKSVYAFNSSNLNENI